MLGSEGERMPQRWGPAWGGGAPDKEKCGLVRCRLGKLVGTQGESRFHPRRLVLLDQAFLDGAVHTAHCRGKQFLSGFGVLGLERRDKFLDLGSQLGAVVAVHCRLTGSATDSFD